MQVIEELIHTFYAPSWVLAVLAAVGVAGLLIGLLGTRKTAL